jgi:hypothetical protein
MSALSDDHLNPHHPMYYAPRWLRERSGSRLPPSQEPTTEQSGRAPAGATFDAQLENAVSEALRHPLDPEVVRQPPGLARDLDRRVALVGVVSRFAAAIGVSAIVALFFVILAPASWQPDSSGSSLSAFIQSMRTALVQPGQTAAAPRPALADFQALLAPSNTGEPATSENQATQDQQSVVTREQSQELLQEFVQWRQRPAPAQPGEK